MLANAARNATRNVRNLGMFLSMTLRSAVDNDHQSRQVLKLCSLVNQKT